MTTNTVKKQDVESNHIDSRLDRARRVSYPMITFLVGAVASQASWDVVAIVFIAMFIMPYFMPKH